MEDPSPTVPGILKPNTWSSNGTNPKQIRFTNPIKNEAKPTPNDESWICAVCKQKKPGHWPRDCPQKK